MIMEITRKELFEKVWEKPMTQVSKELGISDVGLKKICRRHQIPVPGRGYWAKKAAGKLVSKGRLSEVYEEDSQEVQISIRQKGGRPNELSEAIRVC